MTKEQFQQLKSQAFARNLKTKYAPLILSHSAIFNMRRNNPKDALSQIERAIKITSDLFPDVPAHENYPDLHLKRA